MRFVQVKGALFMPTLATLYTARGGYSHSNHNHKVTEVGPQSIKGLVPMMQGDGFASELGGIMEVTMWLCTL